MIRTLALIAAVSFVLAIGCFAGVMASAGGPFWIDDSGQVHRGTWSHWDHDHEDHEHWNRSHDDDGDRSPAAQRDFTWTGGHKLIIDVPADVTYQQGAATKLTISGPQAVLNRLRVQNGEISTDGFGWDDGRLKISLTAPDVDSFEVNGSGDLAITGFNHDQLSVEIAGSGKAAAEGQAKRAELHISGSGDADFTNLKLDEAKVEVSGSGDAVIGPKQMAQVDISGSGNVRLLNAPKTQKFSVSGSGQVTQPNRG
ncbi:GIN domain-containing protein [Phenylobacterium montanum]|uniref:DUF2807 domain-containing protein n=1 Tax=Phenylobacterium montanum TaxID=2823693 RepID=A0A975G2Q7_9CAUL|nr:DUF2807 domain-containing protein [Caulobacter sp. S6]QUD89467.1 DUF2807 domain-containing protein [Caulobacter sp. S6]